MNIVVLSGRLGRDPEIRNAATGTAFCSFRLATDGSYTDRDGNKVDKTDWHIVVTRGRLAEVCNNYLAKGSQALVEGKLETRKYQDSQGQDRYVTEVIARKVEFVGERKQKNSQPPAQDDPYQGHYPGPADNYGGLEDVPF